MLGAIKASKYSPNPMKFLCGGARYRLAFLRPAEHLPADRRRIGARNGAMPEFVFDAVFVLAGIAFLGACAGYAHLCEAL